jgi:hypothetical protein
VQTGLATSAGNSGLIIEVALPRALVPPGDYILFLDGINPTSFEKLDSYSFRVVER